MTGATPLSCRRRDGCGAFGCPAGIECLPDLDDVVELPAGRYRLGEPGEEREVESRAC